MGEWQPIETAPKDGSFILGYLQFQDGYNEMRALMWRNKPEQWIEAWLDGNVYPPYVVTHWMPLPEPPKAEGEE